MKTVKVILAMALGAASCQKSTEPGSAPATGSAAPSAPAAPAPAPAAAAQPADLASLFPGKAPKFPPPLTPLSFKSTDDDAKKALPQGPNERIKLNQFGGDIGLENVVLWANDDASKAWTRGVQLRIKKPVEEVKAKMTAAWGAPHETKKKEFIWVNPPEGLEAILKSASDGSEVDYYPIMDWQAFLGTGKGFGFEKEKPLVGMTPEEVEKTYPMEYNPDPDKKRMMLIFPSLPYNDGGVQVQLDATSGKVTAYQFSLDFDNTPDQGQLVKDMNARVSEKWGKPVKKWLNYRTFGKKPAITVTVNPTQLVFSLK